MAKTCGTCIHCSTTYDGAMGFCRKSGADIALAAFAVVGVRPICGGKDYQERTDSVEQVALDMVQEYRKLMDICVLSGPKAWEMVHVTAEDAERRLEALGVDV